MRNAFKKRFARMVDYQAFKAMMEEQEEIADEIEKNYDFIED